MRWNHEYAPLPVDRMAALAFVLGEVSAATLGHLEWLLTNELHAIRAERRKREREDQSARDREAYMNSRPLAPHERAEADRLTRDLEIVRLAGRGWTNEAIARRYQLHPGTVSRIVRRRIATARGIEALRPTDADDADGSSCASP